MTRCLTRFPRTITASVIMCPKSKNHLSSSVWTVSAANSDGGVIAWHIDGI